jgi:hypothetical protein
MRYSAPRPRLLGNSEGQRERRTRVGWVKTSARTMSEARAARTIRQLLPDGVEASPIVSVEGGVTPGVPVAPSTPPVGEGWLDSTGSSDPVGVGVETTGVGVGTTGVGVGTTGVGVGITGVGVGTMGVGVGTIGVGVGTIGVGVGTIGVGVGTIGVGVGTTGVGVGTTGVGVGTTGVGVGTTGVGVGVTSSQGWMLADLAVLPLDSTR